MAAWLMRWLMRSWVTDRVKVTSSLSGGAGGSGSTLHSSVARGTSPSASRRKTLPTPASVPATRFVAGESKAT